MRIKFRNISEDIIPALETDQKIEECDLSETNYLPSIEHLLFVAASLGLKMIILPRGFTTSEDNAWNYLKKENLPTPNIGFPDCLKAQRIITSRLSFIFRTPISAISTMFPDMSRFTTDQSGNLLITPENVRNDFKKWVEASSDLKVLDFSRCAYVPDLSLLVDCAYKNSCQLRTIVIPRMQTDREEGAQGIFNSTWLNYRDLGMFEFKIHPQNVYDLSYGILNFLRIFSFFKCPS